MMDRPIGSIITAVAVLDIHMDKKAEAPMKPSMIRDGPPPMVLMTSKAIRR